MLLNLAHVTTKPDGNPIATSKIALCVNLMLIVKRKSESARQMVTAVATTFASIIRSFAKVSVVHYRLDTTVR